MYVGRKIKMLRQVLGFTQNDFAEQLDVSQPYYSAIESGKKQISNKMLMLIEKKWGVKKVFFEDISSEEERNVLGVFVGGGNGGNIKNTNSLIPGLDYTVSKDGSWVAEKGSKLDLFITQATNVALISNFMDEKAIPKMVRLMKLEVLMVLNDVIPKKPITKDFGLVIDVLKEMQSKFLADDVNEVVSQSYIETFDKALNSLEAVFFENFDILFKEKSPSSKILNIKTYDDLINYWKAGEHKNEY